MVDDGGNHATFQGSLSVGRHSFLAYDDDDAIKMKQKIRSWLQGTATKLMITRRSRWSSEIHTVDDVAASRCCHEARSERTWVWMKPVHITFDYLRICTATRTSWTKMCTLVNCWGCVHNSFIYNSLWLDTIARPLNALEISVDVSIDIVLYSLETWRSKPEHRYTLEICFRNFKHLWSRDGSCLICCWGYFTWWYTVYMIRLMVINMDIFIIYTVLCV